MKIATLQYSYDFPSSFDDYALKITHLVEKMAQQGVDLLLFPEYAGYEIVSFAPFETFPKWLPSYLELFQKLSSLHQMFICAGTQVVQTDTGVFNRSYFFSPDKAIAHQDKCILTPYEVEEGILSPSHTLRLFETRWGKIAICICYDVEFPMMVNELTHAGAQLLLVPSYTSTVHGFYRVFNSCRARALENQCYVVQSALVGQTDVEIAYGAAAICSPIDEGFPEDGILALGTRDRPEAVIATLDFAKLEKVRAQGQTRNFNDAQQLARTKLKVELLD